MQVFHNFFELIYVSIFFSFSKIAFKVASERASERKAPQ